MGRHFLPLLIPVTAIVAAAVIIFGVSRVLLSFNHETTPMVALGIALAVLLIATLVAARTSDTEEAG